MHTGSTAGEEKPELHTKVMKNTNALVQAMWQRGVADEECGRNVVMQLRG